MNQPPLCHLAVTRHVCLMRQEPDPDFESITKEIQARLPFAPDGVAVLSMDSLTGHSCCLIAPNLKSDGKFVLLEQPGRLVCEDSADVPVTEGLWYVIRQNELRDVNSEPVGVFDTHHVW